MLDQVKPYMPDLSDAEIKTGICEKRALLTRQQQSIKEHHIPVLVLTEGFSASGKGTLLGNLIDDLDPRFFTVITTKAPTAEEKRKPFLWRHMENIPEAGQFVFFDSGWMEETIEDMQNGRLDDAALAARLTSIRIFERQLRDNGYLLVKLFLNISEKEQKHRMEKLQKHHATSWRVNESDLHQLKNRKKYEKAFDRYLCETAADAAPWNLIDASDEKRALYQVLSILTERIDAKLAHPETPISIVRKDFPLNHTPLLSEVPLDQELSRAEYQVRYKDLQKRLKALHNKLYREGIPVVIAYEGWDAAGKGGNIKRLTSALDARGFKVNPIASPEPHEKSRHYLWRFWHRLPKTGHISVFDRSWYGRVMVERLEGFCSENDWQRAYTEINEFEKELTDWGAIVIKFWVQIDKDTQLARFNERQNTPEKQWKITDEDWRNREKWDLYEPAINEMLQKTNTKNAPWYILPSNNKYYARLLAMETLIREIEARLS